MPDKATTVHVKDSPLTIIVVVIALILSVIIYFKTQFTRVYIVPPAPASTQASTVGTDKPAAGAEDSSYASYEPPLNENGGLNGQWSSAISKPYGFRLVFREHPEWENYFPWDSAPIWLRCMNSTEEDPSDQVFRGSCPPTAIAYEIAAKLPDGVTEYHIKAVPAKHVIPLD